MLSRVCGVLLIRFREILYVGIPRRHIYPGRADRGRVDVFPLLALPVGEEPEGGYGDELRGTHVGDVADERVVVAREARDERAAFGFGSKVDGVDEDVELGVGFVNYSIYDCQGGGN